eukprot:14700714-Alexandrium_andersonii.AAC.1
MNRCLSCPTAVMLISSSGQTCEAPAHATAHAQVRSTFATGHATQPPISRTTLATRNRSQHLIYNGVWIY